MSARPVRMVVLPRPGTDRHPLVLPESCEDMATRWHRRTGQRRSGCTLTWAGSGRLSHSWCGCSGHSRSRSPYIQREPCRGNVLLRGRATKSDFQVRKEPHRCLDEGSLCICKLQIHRYHTRSVGGYSLVGLGVPWCYVLP